MSIKNEAKTGVPPQTASKLQLRANKIISHSIYGFIHYELLQPSDIVNYGHHCQELKTQQKA